MYSKPTNILVSCPRCYPGSGPVCNRTATRHPVKAHTCILLRAHHTPVPTKQQLPERKRSLCCTFCLSVVCRPLSAVGQGPQTACSLGQQRHKQGQQLLTDNLVSWVQLVQSWVQSMQPYKAASVCSCMDMDVGTPNTMHLVLLLLRIPAVQLPAAAACLQPQHCVMSRHCTTTVVTGSCTYICVSLCALCSASSALPKPC